MIRRHDARGAVQINYDDTKTPYHCPHCGQEFFPDDVICISCGYEFADEGHPYALPLIRPMPLLDLTGQLAPDAVDALRTRLAALRDALGMEVLLTVMSDAQGRPPEEVAWFLANAWELGGITSPRDWPAPQPLPEGCLAVGGEVAKQLALLPVNAVKSLLKLIGGLVSPAKAPDQRGLAIFVFINERTITLEPTIAAEPSFDWSRAAEGLAPLAERMGEAELGIVLGDLLEAVVGWKR